MGADGGPSRAHALPALAPVDRRSAADRVVDRVVTAIAVGAYSPGEQLPPERELAGLLEVSRPTLRAGLTRLVALGLLESRRGRSGGTFVTTRSWRDAAPEAARRTLETELPALRELFDFRCLVEGMIARAAATRCTPADATVLQELLAQFDRAEGMAAARALDARLHGEVVRVARNPHLVSLSAQLTAAVTLGFGSEPYAEEYYAAASHQHRALVERVVAGDADGANRVATEHFRMTETVMAAGLAAARDV